MKHIFGFVAPKLQLATVSSRTQRLVTTIRYRLAIWVVIAATNAMKLFIACHHKIN